MTAAELQALRDVCDYADRKQNPTVVISVALARSIIADYTVVPDPPCPIQGPHNPRWFNPDSGAYHCMGNHE